MSKFKKMTFLKVLTTIAWADGEISQSEINIFKTFYRKFDLEKHEMDEAKPGKTHRSGAVGRLVSPWQVNG